VAVHLCLCRRKNETRVIMDHLKMSMKLSVIGRVALHFPYVCCSPHYTVFQCPLKSQHIVIFSQQSRQYYTCTSHLAAMSLWCAPVKLITKTIELETKSGSRSHKSDEIVCALIVNCDAIWPSREEGWLWSLLNELNVKCLCRGLKT